jgi:hypothetical protein
MKLWKGIELEGEDKGIVTMFVSGVTIHSDEVVRCLLENSDCKRLYLGGGRIDVKEILNPVKLFSFCSKNSIPVILECSLSEIENLAELLFDDVDQVIVRIDNRLVHLLSEDDLIKLDSHLDVHIIRKGNMIHTSLENLNKDMFSTDILIYDDSMGGYIK